MYLAGKSPETEFLLNRYSCTDFLYLTEAFGRILMVLKLKN